MTGKMEISQREAENGVTVITVAGRVMLGEESAKIESSIEELIAAGKKLVVFDVSGVDHIDSTGIGRFISALNKIMQAGGRLRMANASKIVREGFRVTRLDTVFEFCDDVDTACQGMN
jgi:anti-sigma B factor antagonist